MSVAINTDDDELNKDHFDADFETEEAHDETGANMSWSLVCRSNSVTDCLF